jgi:glycosyltransferase involved in cell wall biosynthesis
MIRFCLTSQTPPATPLHPEKPPTRRVWKLGQDYEPQLGGVVPMMRALIRVSQGRWMAPHPLWISLGGDSLPASFATDEGYNVETITLEPRLQAAYVRFKDDVWRSFHGPWGLEPFVSDDYQAYVDYNHRTAQHLLRHMGEYDLFYVNDFQLLLVGALVGSAAPAILRWHIPLEFRGYPEPVRRFFMRSMEGFDAIVVSTRTALEELIHHGFHGRAYQIYPYVDPDEHPPASLSSVRQFREKFHLGASPYIISVGRMDPVKRQDLLIQAFARVHRKFPDHRLVLVGGGSFSTKLSKSRGERSKDELWWQRIQQLIRRLKVEDSVVVAGKVSNEELRAAYDGAQSFVHPAPWEGFGLVAVEAWLHGLPVIVSRGAGVSELVTDGVNGFAVAPGSVSALTARMEALLAHPAEAERMGEAGRLTARRCHVRIASRRLREITHHVMDMYRNPGRAPPRILRG